MPPPGEELVGIEIVAPCDLGDRGAICEALLDIHTYAGATAHVCRPRM